jgi:nucleotide-binding universal stress UspA family protein
LHRESWKTSHHRRNKSRPNTPVDVPVELYDHYLYDLRVRYTLGLCELDEVGARRRADGASAGCVDGRVATNAEGIHPMYERTWPVTDAADRIRKQRAQKRAEIEARRKQAQSWATIVAKVIGEADPGVEQVIGFGSTFETWRKYRSDSDVDLAMVGGEWSRAMERLPSGEFAVSLIELELQPDEFADHVRSHGTVLYERS